MDKIDFKYLLGCIRALSSGYQQAHWICRNSVFYQDHLLAERLYGDAYGMVDKIAEKAMGLTKDASRIDLLEVLKEEYKKLKSFPQSAKDNGEMFKFMLKMEEDFIALCDEIEDNEEASLGLENMMADFADAAEGRMYLLQQRLSSGSK